MKKVMASAFLLSLAFYFSASPAHCQRVRKDLLEKSHWYVSPREYQILDNRPVIRDFREGPGTSGTINLPPGPGGPAAGGSGAGALAGGNPGSTPTAAETQLGDPYNQGFRNAPSDLTTLPKSGFGGQNSNMSSYKPPLKALPFGRSTNLLSGKKFPSGYAPGTGQGLRRGIAPGAGQANGVSHVPAPATYGSNYGPGSGFGSGGSSSRTEQKVRGSLLHAK